MSKHTTITSAQRFTIFEIIDLAIDLSQKGIWKASAQYSGANHQVTLYTARTNGEESNDDSSMLIVYLNHRGRVTPEENNNRIEKQLREMIEHLEALLQEDEKP